MTFVSTGLLLEFLIPPPLPFVELLVMMTFVSTGSLLWLAIPPVNVLQFRFSLMVTFVSTGSLSTLITPPPEPLLMVTS